MFIESESEEYQGQEKNQGNEKHLMSECTSSKYVTFV